ncbi:MAG TPA: HEAT repeat domain-containing protein [Planctomycetota bacterium]|nr:HEAT repeat domain-containing protein [Planctomycetota bacterium]
MRCHSHLLILCFSLCNLLSAADAPAGSAPAGAAALISAAAKEKLTTASADKLTRELTSLGLPAIPAVVSELERAAPVKSVVVCPLITVLVRLHATESAPLMVKLAREQENENVRDAALQALAAFKEAATVPQMMELLAEGIRKPLADSHADSKRTEVLCQTLIELNKSYECSQVFASTVAHQATTASEELKLQWVYILQHGTFRSTERSLLSLTQGSAVHVAAAAVQALGTAGSRATEPQLAAFLRSKERKIRASAALAAGKLKAVSVVPQLIELLSDREQDVPESALWALKSVSGMQFGRDAQRWRHWYEGERATAQKQLDALRESLTAKDSRALAVTLEQICAIALLRDKLYSTVIAYADHTDDCVRAACCAVLGESGDTRAMVKLANMIADPSAEVSFAAWRALKSATGEQLPRDPALWREYAQKRGM